MYIKKMAIFFSILGLINLLPLDAFSTSPQATYNIHYPNQVMQLFTQVNPQFLSKDLEKLTSFPNRNANSEYGLEAENWIKTQIKTIAQEYQRTDFSIRTIATPNSTSALKYDYISSKWLPFSSYKQSSIILKIGTSNEPGIIIGAHMDTLGDYSEYVQRDDFYTSAHDFLLLPDDAKAETFSAQLYTIRLQRKNGNVIAYWNKPAIEGDQIINKVISLENLKRANLEKIISLFPKNGMWPRRMLRTEDSELLDSIASLCNFIHLAVGGVFPGADDDGSGTVTLLETARALLASPIRFKKPIYIIWYAAEENDELGSQEVVKDFKDKNIPVEAIMQLDQTGYIFDNDPTIYLDVDKTDDSLNQYLKTLASYYLKQPVKFTHGGGGSDHEQWFWAGYKNIVRPGEDYSHSPSNPYMHSQEDTMDKLSINHMIDYLKLTLAFVTELAEPVSQAK